MKTAIRLIYLTASLLAAATFTAGQPNEAFSHSGHHSGLAAIITLQNGTVRTVKLDGAGCAASICSRVAIRAKTAAAQPATAWFDDLAAIRDTDAGCATFIRKDGAVQRLTLLPDFRVLYLTGADRSTEKLDLAQVRSLDFATSGSELVIPVRRKP